ncbi:hypothetical protein [Legionella feeleii]|uniref:Uncharacterized protein n=1 Tax=Legionella feeleii TaxID=453 RepID=A0A0W0UB38_9GAMM|nr:hypothetical protein [Legionella feeleii]KTD05172.1 hypothetical protein Lfee_0008 [Legionella feeleii]SPX61050.1 Uncharacterised protein [Legionella feeleii]
MSLKKIVTNMNTELSSYYRNGLNKFFTPFNSNDSFYSVFFENYLEKGLNKYFFAGLTVGLISNNIPFFLNYYFPVYLAISAIVFTGFAALSAIYAVQSVVELLMSKFDRSADSLECSGQLLKTSLALPALSSIFDTFTLLTRSAVTLVNGKSKEEIELTAMGF